MNRASISSKDRRVYAVGISALVYAARKRFLQLKLYALAPATKVVLAVTAVSLTLLLHAWYYWPFVSDDALIALRYSRNFARGLGLVWNEGQRVEGYTCFLWVVLNAALIRFGVDPIVSARIMGVGGVLAAIVGISLTHDRFWRIDLRRLLSGGLLFALSAPAAVWAIGGMEQGLLMGLLTYALILGRRAILLGRAGCYETWLAGALYALLTLLRADGALFICAAGGATLLYWRGARRGWALAAILVLPSVIAFLSQLTFRVLYYGEWVPNTALVKVSFNLTRLANGWRYIAHGSSPLGILIFLTLVVLGISISSWWRKRVTAKSPLLPLVTLLVSVVYVIVIGGDIFPGWRMLVAPLVCLCVLVADLGERVLVLGSPWGRCFSLFFVLLILGHLKLQFRDAENIRAKQETWEWGGLPIGKLLRSAFSTKRPLLAVDAAGAVPFWSELPALDMLGLNDKFLAHNKPADFGLGQIGHELGSGAYFMKMRPDLYLFCSAVGHYEPCFRGGREVWRMPEFHTLYQPVVLRAKDPYEQLGFAFIRREQSVIGIARSANEISVPGYLMTGAGAAATLDPTGQLVLELRNNVPAHAANIEIPDGLWNIKVETTQPGAALSILCNGRSLPGAGGTGDQLVMMVRGTQRMDLRVVLQSTGAIGQLRALRFTRLPERELAPGIAVCGGERHRVAFEQSAVASFAAEHAFWSDPPHIVMGPEGISIRMLTPREVRAVELTLDNNDSYTINLRYLGQTVHTFSAPEKFNGGGLAQRTLTVGSASQYPVADEVWITPQRGDGRYSLGHLRFLDDRAQ